ncbi:fatty acid-binding protein, adipocyte-like [Tubulanus polymorphus]|uniref:fatty acid-binding protein, adipocyte-like n=1 Tax=Tubulanus polymorphus TaxID=672921 RepID=UPI003DA41464
MDVFIGKTWVYHHELSDKSEHTFLDAAGVPKETQTKIIEAIPIMIFSKDGDELTIRIESKDHVLIRENKAKLGIESDTVTPDGRKAKTLMKMEGGVLKAEVKVEGLDFVVSTIHEIKDDDLHVTFDIPALALKTTTVFKNEK